jgi:twitching motility two-component system response regulator PilH
MTIRTILIVDDVQADLLNLQGMVNSAGYNVISASSGAEAVQRAKSDRPDLIFMDIIMDGVNGYDACRAIKEDPETTAIPIVFVSIKKQKADHLWAKRQGGLALIGKPYTREDIIQQINSIG